MVQCFSRILTIIVTSVTILSLVSCQKSGEVAEEDTEATYYVNGDPLTFLAGTTPRRQSNFGENDFPDDSSYLMTSIGILKHTDKAQSKDEYVDDQAKPKKVKREELYGNLQFFVKRKAETLQLSNKSGSSQFQFKLDDKKMWALEQLTISETTVSDFSVLHYSINEEKTPGEKNFSLLIQYKENLYAFSFSALKKEHQVDGEFVIKTNNSSVVSISGTGVSASWNHQKELKIRFCNSDEAPFKNLALESLEQWNEVLKERIVVKIEDGTCPPFSDVNVQGIYLVDNYFTLPHLPTLMNPAAVLPKTDFSSGRLVDADMFFFKSEFFDKQDLSHLKKSSFSGSLQKSELKRYFTHELGHMLGLGHDFSKKDSIMNYSYKFSWLGNYDKEAILVLYPEKRVLGPLEENKESEKK